MSNPLPRTVAALLVALLTTSAGCGPSSSDHRAVVADNETLRGQVEALQSRLQELTARNEELEAIHDGTRVSLANTELHRLTSRDNGETHEIKVWRPRGYAQGTEPLPVLYVIDAETNFGGVSYIVQRLIKDRLIPEMLVVGIAYGTTYDRFYELRGRDLTPTKDPSFRRGKPSGEAPAFSRFLETQVFPLVRETYRADENRRAIYGHSLGGLYGFYALLRAPHLFDRYLLLSPSLWWDQDVLFDWLELELPERRVSRLYVASGELEHRIDDQQLAFVARLTEREPELEIRSEVFSGETHRTVFGRGFTNGLRYLFADDAPE